MCSLFILLRLQYNKLIEYYNQQSHCGKKMAGATFKTWKKMFNHRIYWKYYLYYMYIIVGIIVYNVERIVN